MIVDQNDFDTRNTVIPIQCYNTVVKLNTRTVHCDVMHHVSGLFCGFFFFCLNCQLFDLVVPYKLHNLAKLYNYIRLGIQHEIRAVIWSANQGKLKSE